MAAEVSLPVWATWLPCRGRQVSPVGGGRARLPHCGLRENTGARSAIRIALRRCYVASHCHRLRTRNCGLGIHSERNNFSKPTVLHDRRRYQQESGDHTFRIGIPLPFLTEGFVLGMYSFGKPSPQRFISCLFIACVRPGTLGCGRRVVAWQLAVASQSERWHS